MEEETAQQLLKELKEINKHIEEMKQDTNYQLRRIATRLEDMNK